MHIVMSRHDLWCAVDDLREQVARALDADRASAAAALAIGGLGTLEMLLRPGAGDPPQPGWPAALPESLPEAAPAEPPIAARKAEVASVAATAPAAAPARPRRPVEGADALWLTDERRTLLQQVWGDSDHTLRTIVAALNTVPGRPVHNDSQVYRLVEMAGLPRTRTAAGLAPPPPKPTASGETDNRPRSPDDEDLIEAKAMARGGGARRGTSPRSSAGRSTRPRG